MTDKKSGVPGATRTRSTDLGGLGFIQLTDGDISSRISDLH